MAGSFTGLSSQNIDISSYAPSLKIPQGSVSLWFKMPDPGISCLISGGQLGSTGGSSLFIGGNMNSSVSNESIGWFGVLTNLQMYVTNGTDFYNDGEWHNTIIVADGSDNRIYVDGVREAVFFFNGGPATANGLFNQSTFNAFFLGQRQNNSVFLTGDLFDVRIYDNTNYIDDAQAKIIYESRGNDNITKGLKARWKLDEGQDGSTITNPLDISGNGFDGTPTNAPVYEAAPFTTG